MSRTSVTSRDLADFLSEQLAGELNSSGYRVVAEGSEVVLSSPGGAQSRNGAAEILDDAEDDRSVEERAATAARAVLSHVQDAVAAESGQPWPGAGTSLPLPGARTEGGTLSAWFGDPDRPVWRSAELPLSR